MLQITTEMECLIRAAEQVFGYSRDRFMGSRKYEPIVTVRKCIYHSAHRIGLPALTIAQAFGKHPSSVLHSLHHKNLKAREEEKIRHIIIIAERMLNSQPHKREDILCQMS